MDSILDTIKKMVLGYIPINSDDPAEQVAFDTDLIVNINTAFAVLTQLGAGPTGGFFITDSTSKWSDFIADDPIIEMIKQYVYIKTRLGFDQPTNSSGIDLMNKIAEEYEWRIKEHFANYE